MVEHTTENRSVDSSILSLATTNDKNNNDLYGTGKGAIFAADAVWTPSATCQAQSGSLVVQFHTRTLFRLAAFSRFAVIKTRDDPPTIRECGPKARCK